MDIAAIIDEFLDNMDWLNESQLGAANDNRK